MLIFRRVLYHFLPSLCVFYVVYLKDELLASYMVSLIFMLYLWRLVIWYVCRSRNYYFLSFLNVTFIDFEERWDMAQGTVDSDFDSNPDMARRRYAWFRVPFQLFLYLVHITMATFPKLKRTKKRTVSETFCTFMVWFRGFETSLFPASSLTCSH